MGLLGYRKFLLSFDSRADVSWAYGSGILVDDKWPGYSPGITFTLTWVLCVAIGELASGRILTSGFAVPVLCSWHIFMILRNETSIESHDNTYLEGRAKADGLIYLNPYDVGRRRNLQQFFNIGPDG